MKVFVSVEVSDNVAEAVRKLVNVHVGVGESRSRDKELDTSSDTDVDADVEKLRDLDGEYRGQLAIVELMRHDASA